ncbi:hypothetical protein ABZP36_016174 [Zizania latifolia]
MRLDWRDGCEVLSCDKAFVARRFGVPARDLRILGHLLSRSPSILGFQNETSTSDSADRLMNEMSNMSNDKDTEDIIVNGNGTEPGHIIVTSIDGRNGQPKQVLSTPTREEIKCMNPGSLYMEEVHAKAIRRLEISEKLYGEEVNRVTPETETTLQALENTVNMEKDFIRTMNT